MEKRVMPLQNGQGRSERSYPLHESIARRETEAIMNSTLVKPSELGQKAYVKLRLNREEVCLRELMEEIRSIIQSDLLKQQLNFDFDISQVVNQYIEADRLRLKQILLNVLSNAMNFNRLGGKVSLQVREMNKSCNGYGVYEFRIKDTGVGMHKEFIYKLFSTAHSGRSEKADLPGTGFSVIKKLVDRMGGTIAVSSKVGKGTEFIILMWFSLSEKNLVPAGEVQQGDRVIKELTSKGITLKLHRT